MHVAINAQLLSFSQNYRNGGISRYIRSLLVGLAEWLQTDEREDEAAQKAGWGPADALAPGLPGAIQQGLVERLCPDAWGASSKAEQDFDVKTMPGASLTRSDCADRPGDGQQSCARTRGARPAMAHARRDYKFTIFVNGEDVVERLAAVHPQMNYVVVPCSESRPTSRIAWEQLQLPSLLRRHHVDVLHSPANVLPALLPSTCAGVVTLHDLAFLRFPDVLTRAKRLYHRSFTIHSLQRATRIISVSESTRKDVMKLVGVGGERVQTVYPCIDKRFSNVIGDKEIAAFRERQGLRRGFLLYLGTLEPRKNLIKLIEAYARLRTEYEIEEKLVVAGGRGWMYKAIFEKVQALGLGSEVIFPGFVADEEQVLWYRAASAFVYPSLYEGFGLPVAEALACGTPVVTSNVSSLPEAGADIALTIDPDDGRAMEEAIYKALTDEALRQRCRAMAPIVAQRFSAQAMVERTVSVYEQAFRTAAREAIA